MPLSPTTSVQDEELSRAYKDAGRKLDRLAQSGVSWSGNERNCAFMNTGKGQFANVSSASGFDFADDGRSLALVDWDHDGDLDVWAANRSSPRIRFLRNETTTGHRFIEFQLQGKTSNRDGIGARLEVVVDKDDAQRKLIKTLRAGEGFLGQSSKTVHFGLGPNGHVQSLTVRWPHGNVETITGLQSNNRYLIVEDSKQPKRLEPFSRQLKVYPAANVAPTTDGRLQVELKTPVPLPRLSFRSLDGEDKHLSDHLGRPVLLTLWASWCRPCIEELQQFVEQEIALRELGVDIIALSVDPIETESPANNAIGETPAIAHLDQLAFPFDAGLADSALVEKLQLVHDSLFRPHRPLPLPVSVLVDQDGRLAAIYKGKISFNRLRKDVARLSINGPERLSAVLPFKGKWHAPPRGLRLLPLTAALIEQGFLDDAIHYLEQNRVDLARDAGFHELLNRLGTALFERNDVDRAIAFFNDALNHAPDDADGYYNLGTAMSAKGDLNSAVANYHRAIELQPDHVKAINNLANVFVARKKFVQAERIYLQALQFKPESADIHYNLGALYLRGNQADKARQEFENALRWNPSHAQAHNNLGILLASSNMDAAIHHYRQATQLDPNYAQAHNNLATALASQGLLDEAIEHYQTSVTLQPQLASAHLNLGRAFAMRGNYRGAVDALHRAVEIEPDRSSTLVSLAWILATHPDQNVRNPEMSLRLAEHAAQLRPNPSPNTLDTLAAAYATNGRFDDAIEFARQAIEILVRDNQDQKAAPIQHRLELYEQGQAYRQSDKNR